VRTLLIGRLEHGLSPRADPGDLFDIPPVGAHEFAQEPENAAKVGLLLHSIGHPRRNRIFVLLLRHRLPLAGEQPGHGPIPNRALQHQESLSRTMRALAASGAAAFSDLRAVTGDRAHAPHHPSSRTAAAQEHTYRMWHGGR